MQQHLHATAPQVWYKNVSHHTAADLQVLLIEKFSDPGTWDTAGAEAAAAAAALAAAAAAAAVAGSKASTVVAAGATAVEVGAGDAAAAAAAAAAVAAAMRGAPMPAWLATLHEALSADDTPR
jgi:hypothetical protein